MEIKRCRGVQEHSGIGNLSWWRCSENNMWYSGGAESGCDDARICIWKLINAIAVEFERKLEYKIALETTQWQILLNETFCIGVLVHHERTVWNFSRSLQSYKMFTQCIPGTQKVEVWVLEILIFHYLFHTHVNRRIIRIETCWKRTALLDTVCDRKTHPPGRQSRANRPKQSWNKTGHPPGGPWRLNAERVAPAIKIKECH